MRVTETAGYLTKEGSERSRILSPDTLIIANSGATLGVAKILGLRCCANDGIAAIIKQHSGHKEFLCYYINTQTDRLREVIATGNGQPNLNTKLIRALLVPFPNEREQRKIAAALSDIDGLIASLEALIAKKQAIKQGMMQQLLTGRTRLHGFTARWKRRKIGELLAPRVERHSGADRLEVLSCTKHQGFVRSLDYFKNQVFSRNLEGYKVIRRGDIGYPANHVEEGSIGVQESFDAALVSPIYVVMRPLMGVDTYFLQRQLKLDSFRQEFARVTNASVNRRGSLRWPEFSEIEVLVPDEEEQRAIARALRDGEAEVRAVQLRLAKTRAIKQGMAQMLLTGRTRLSVQDTVS
jgi:type I restriction enzyme S subunit